MSDNSTRKENISVALRSLPSVDALLSDERLLALADRFSRKTVASLVRRNLSEARQIIISDGSGMQAPAFADLIAAVERDADVGWASSPIRVINASGVILHTNLGRAPLSPEAARAASLAAQGYSNLELDLIHGRRGSRHSHISSMLPALTGAEAGIAVNNNAGAALLVISALAGSGREVIVSRSEAVEIGGGFRIPDVMRQSGSKLVEVGTTNRTYASDYEDAINRETALILKVHRSNFTISGFTHDPKLREIVAVAAKHEAPLVYDLGSGCILDTSQFGIHREPTVQDSIRDGADVVMFSGDKLLGGPQAGIIVGKKNLIDRISKHPLARALRIDKMTLAALNSTLRSYLKGEAVYKIPIWQMISAEEEEIKRRALEWQLSIDSEVARGSTAIGGGSMPGQMLPTWRLQISVKHDAEEISKWMRNYQARIIGRIEEHQLCLDPRTVMPHEDATVSAALRQYAGAAS